MEFRNTVYNKTERKIETSFQLEDTFVKQVEGSWFETKRKLFKINLHP